MPAVHPADLAAMRALWAAVVVQTLRQFAERTMALRGDSKGAARHADRVTSYWRSPDAILALTFAGIEPTSSVRRKLTEASLGGQGHALLNQRGWS